ncbi:MAG: gliding motility-associated C-terminal domain-containing protein [Anaerolineae bacterium]|nr:gliding motility-associated C-terminal domain-containing protein [Anaerolineae bacterium]
MLYNVSISPETITPNADGLTDVTRINYHLTRSANLSIYLTNNQGQQFFFRNNRRRSAGEYQVDFGGVVNGDMLPNGVYTWVVEAVSDDGETATRQGTLTIQNADTKQPELQGFSVYPQTFTPNQDGIDDRVDINYYLTKTADVSVYLVAADGKTRYPLAEVERDIKPGEPGFHTYDYEGGVDLGADPPPDGLYTVEAEAVDRVGNRTLVTSTLTIAEGGVPRADIVSASVDFYNPETGDQVVPLGATLAFTLTVENFGNVPIRTTGPNSGEHYRSDENFNTKGVHESSGAWRIGIDYEGNPSYAYPYRWAIGNLNELEKRVINNNPEYYLMPGQRAVVTGSIQIMDNPTNKDRINFWAGLIHEHVSIDVFNDHVDPQPIVIGF